MRRKVMKKRVVTYAIAAAMAMSLVMTASVSAAERRQERGKNADFSGA